MHLGQKVPFALACFQASAVPRLENPDSDKKHALTNNLISQYTRRIFHCFTMTISFHSCFNQGRAVPEVQGVSHRQMNTLNEVCSFAYGVSSTRAATY
jgi:hypothetical protein